MQGAALSTTKTIEPEVVYSEQLQANYWAVFIQHNGVDYRWDISSANGRWQAASLDFDENPMRGQVFYSKSEALSGVKHLVASIVPNYS